MASRILEVILQAKDQASAVIGKAESNIQSSTSKMATAFKVFAASAAALAIGHFLKDSVDEALKAEEGMARLGVAVRNAGGNFDQLKPSLERTVDGLVRLTKYTDDDLRAALTNMVTLTGDVAGSQKNLALVADLAAARQIDLGTASDLVSKAMNGTVTGLNKLGFAGKDAETVLKNLGTAVNGFAEKEAQTFGGQLTRLTNQWGEFKEAVGLAIISGDKAGGALGGLTGILASVSDFITENKEAIGSLVNALFAMGEAVWQIVRLPLKGLGMALSAIMDVIGLVMQAIGTLIDTGGSLLAKFGLDFGTSVGASIRDAGIAMQKAAVSAAGAIWGVEKKSQDDQTKLVDAGGQARVKLTKQEQADREKSAKDHAKKIADVEVEIATYALAIERGITKDKAKELIQRELDLGHSLGVQVSTLASGYQRLDALRDKYESGWTRHLQTIVDSIAQATPKVVSSSSRMIEATGGLDGQLGAVAKVARDAQGRLGAMSEEQDRAADSADRLTEQLERGARGAIGLASGLLGISDAAANAANNVVSVASSLQSLFKNGFKGDIAGTITELVGAAVSLIKGIFGESPEEKARKQLLRDNTAALKALTTATGDLAKVSAPGSEVARIRDFLGGLFGPQGQYTKGSYTAGKLKAGISDAEIEALAKELGINVRNSKSGAIESGALFQLFQALQGADVGFANTFAGQLERIRRGMSLGAITQGQEFGQLLGAIGSGGDNAITRTLAGANFSTMEGRTAAADSLRGLFANIGSLRPQDLGGLNQSEFLDALQQLVDILINPERVIDPLTAATGASAGMDLTASFDAFTEVGEQQVDYLSSIDTNIGQLLTRWTDIDTGQAVGLAASPVTITVGDINIASATDPTATADAVQAAVTDALNQALADSYLNRQLATGNVTRTVS